jgi:hypothetical protein
MAAIRSAPVPRAATLFRDGIHQDDNMRAYGVARCFWEVRGEDYGCAWERKTGTLLRLLIRGLKGGWTQPRNVPVLLGAAFLLVKVVGGEDDGLG